MTLLLQKLELINTSDYPNVTYVRGENVEHQERRRLENICTEDMEDIGNARHTLDNESCQKIYPKTLKIETKVTITLNVKHKDILNMKEEKSFPLLVVSSLGVTG